MIKKIFILSLLALSPLSFAQDIIFLKNGDALKGKITAKTPYEVTIENDCGIYHLQHAEIDSSGNSQQKGKKETGYLAGFSVGVLAGSTVNEIPYPFSLMMEQEYKFSPYFSSGAFLGFEAINEPTAPVGVMVKGILPYNESSFFLGAKAGFGFSLEKPEPEAYNYYYYEITEANGGWLYNVEVGYSFPSTEHNSFFIALGYRYQELHYKLDSYYLNVVDRVMYFNRISLRLGIQFY